MAKPKPEIVTTYEQLRESVPAINILIGKPLRAANALIIGRVAKLVEVEVTAFNEQHRILIEKHGGEADEAGQMSVPAEEIEAFTPEFTEMLETEIVLQTRPLPVKVLDGIDMTANDMMQLDFLFEE